VLATVKDIIEDELVFDLLKTQDLDNSDDVKTTLRKYFDVNEESTYNPRETIWNKVKTHGSLAEIAGQPKFN
jgi:hypothetical protein